MKKRLIAIILITMIAVSFMTLSSCVKGDNKGKETNNSTNTNTDKIQIWYYNSEDSFSSIFASQIASGSEQYCRINNIPLEVVVCDGNTISYEDYVLKRNLALASGNIIVIEAARDMQDIAKQHADYTKIENYNNLLSIYKDRFCIPLGIIYFAADNINNKAMDYYGISTYANPVITYCDYLEIKQEMKEKGARFTINSKEFLQLIEYYLYTNGLLYINYDNEILQNESKMKDILRKSILDLCNDIILYNNGKLEIESESQESLKKSSHIYDENSNLILWNDGYVRNGFFDIDGLETISNRDELDVNNTTFMINPDFGSGPSFYMYKKITNDKIYDLANYIVSESTYLMVNYRRGAAPVFNIQGMDKTKEELSIDDNWEFVVKEEHGKVPKRFKMIINSTYELFAKNEEKSRKLADGYLSNWDYANKIKSLVEEIVKEIAHKLSNNTIDEDLSIEKFDYENEEMKKIIDDKINEFVINFLIHNS